MGFSIGIDGPASAGKSTLAKGIAKRLSFKYVDTGAIYRAYGLYCIENNISMYDEEKVSSNIHLVNIKIQYVDNVQETLLNGVNVTNKLRSDEVGKAASVTSQYKRVREYLLDMQREFAKANDVVMDGRDICTVVLPNANIKIFLVATLEERAKRRIKEYLAKGINEDYDKVYKEMEARDLRDTSRDVSPLMPAEDSIILDTTNMSIEEEIEFVVKIYNEKIKRN